MYFDPHDGSYGLDLRPAGELEAYDELARERRRRREPMSVAQRVRMVAQPRGGLLPASIFERIPMGDARALHPMSAETVPPDIAGLFVDYMTRVADGVDPRVAFRIPLLGARLVGRSVEAERLVRRIRGFDPGSVRAACLLLDFDRASRRGPGAWSPRPAAPDGGTRWNLVRMVARSRVFLDHYGPVAWEGFTFEGGYTDLVTSGSGDFLTRDTIWDFKVSVAREPRPEWTLQLLAYWRLGVHSIHEEYGSIRRLGFFNPRRDAAWLLDVTRIDPGLVGWVDRELIGYPS